MPNTLLKNNKMNKHLFIFILVLPFSLRAQMKPNNLYFELGGNGIYYSVNYERNILSASKLQLNTRIGLTTIGIENIGLPFEANVLFGKEEQRSFLEIGIGGTPMYSYTRKAERNGTWGKRKSEFDLIALGRFGYRYVSEKGFLLRFAFTPVFERKYFPWAGISIGKNF